MNDLYTCREAWYSLQWKLAVLQTQNLCNKCINLITSLLHFYFVIKYMMLCEKYMSKYIYI